MGEDGDTPGSIGWLVIRFVTTYNERDWDGLAALTAPEFRLLDHRPTGWGEIDISAYVNLCVALVDMAPDAVLTCDETLRVVQDGALVSLHVAGVSDEGTEFEIRTYAILISRDGRFVRSDVYAVEDLRDAVAQFDKLTAE